MVKLNKSDKKFWAGALSVLLAISFYVDLLDFKTKVLEGSVVTIGIALGIIYLIWMLVRKN
jgi:uncharacterized membrane protein required for colicin V production